ncbi:MAG: succinate dehydrogenase cytochrome b subunit [Verrucomicrobia bacterium]|nr:succinate dehydrogenase cytochrome b subunit [Verrucomicrobiota bacterium]
MSLLASSLGKKYIMALSGLVLSLFVLGHMLGNLQVFGDPYLINAYGYKLQHLPYGLLWIIRLFLLACVLAHIWAAITLKIQNKKARPEEYEQKATVQASLASRTMIMSGLIILLFLIFHLLHYTVRAVPGHEYNQAIVTNDGTEYPAEVILIKNGKPMVDSYGKPLQVHNLHDMMVAGFSYPLISLFYVVATYLLCMHLSHGVSSMFQSVGLRNETWRYRLDIIGKIYGWVLFLGYASIPISIWLGVVKATV